MSILDKDSKVNLTPIGKLFNKRTDRFAIQKREILDEIALKSDNQKMANGILRQKQGGLGYFLLSFFS